MAFKWWCCTCLAKPWARRCWRGIYGQRYTSDGVKAGGEFRVNSTTVGDQTWARATTLPSGDFVITWVSDEDGLGGDIFGQRYSEDGTALGVEFRINTYTDADQSFSNVTALSDNAFVVTWHSKHQDDSEYGIYAQRFNADGVASGAEFRVNTTTEYSQERPSIAGLSDGGFIATWGSQNSSSHDVYGQIYNAEGDTLGGEFRVNTYISNAQRFPFVTGLENGDFVVVWRSEGQDGSNTGIYGQLFKRYEAVSIDTDSDGVTDSQDAFPNDPAASVDTDGDGMPDDWNEGKTQADSTSDPVLVLDEDDDNDGILDQQDFYPKFPIAGNTLVFAGDVKLENEFLNSSDATQVLLGGTQGTPAQVRGLLALKMATSASAISERRTTYYETVLLCRLSINDLPANSACWGNTDVGLAGDGDPWNRVGVNAYYSGGILVGSAELAYGRFEFLFNDLMGFSVGDPFPELGSLLTEDNLFDAFAIFQWEDQGEGLGRVVSRLELELLVDTDGDGRPDDCGFVCESFGIGADVDDDNDDVDDEIDNCPLLANAEQSDFEGDGIGDACDADDDGDGVADSSDAFR